MPISTQASGQEASSSDKKSASPVPSISLPKGGGAIRGIGEKFAANPVTGTGSITVPIAASPGRSGFGPQLSLSYDSGAGNGPFGFGWSLALPSITRKTDKGLPQYWDAQESDVFILSGAEDLVPVLIEKNGVWEREQPQIRTVHDKTYRIQRYRPRLEGLFARIERWIRIDDAGDTFWRSISRDNITTWYGKTPESRIADPADPSRIFSWLICESHDDKGNVIVYRYKEENNDNVALDQVNERHRVRSANRYLKRIRYGNHAPYFPKLAAGQPWPTPPGTTGTEGSSDWFFEVVFDYGEHHSDRPLSNKFEKNWGCRNDQFSSYRAGFEIRTYRFCQRVLMFHHFPGEAGVGSDCLVRSTDFTYFYEKNPADARNPIFSLLQAVTQTGYQHQQLGGGYLSKSLPPLEFEYSQAVIGQEIHDVDPASLENLPAGADGSAYQWVDLDGEGLSGILTEQGGGWFYKRNESPLSRDSATHQFIARFAPVEQVARRPAGSPLTVSHMQFLDLAGDGQVDLVDFDRPNSGFYERTHDQDWQPFRAFQSIPHLDWQDPNLRFIDLTGDGHADALISEEQVFTWYPSLAEAGFDQARRVPVASDEEHGPRVVFADATQSISLADLSGDGLTDIVRIRNGEVCYWPNLGYGRFGAKVTMDDAPWFDTPDQFDPRRLRLADIDGTGVTDIIYLGRNQTRFWFNQSGNGWSQPHDLPAFPPVDNLASVTAVDLLGDGTACLVWSSPLPGANHAPMQYLNLMAAGKPHLLTRTVNNLGAETKVDYASSTYFYLKDKQAGKPWLTKLPFPVHCVEKVTVHDQWRQTTFATTYSYHHGYFDGQEREFRGFGRVEQVDIEDYGTFAAGNQASPYITDDLTLYQPPVKTVTWYHTGAFLDRQQILSQFRQEYFPHWFEALRPGEVNVLGEFQENLLPEPDLLTAELSSEEFREALRACKGMMLRQEVYELDVEALQQNEQLPVKLFTTAYHNCHIRCLQPLATNRHAVFLVAESEAITYHYELDLRPQTVSPDPRVAHTLNLKFDEYGNVLQSVAVVYKRREQFQGDSLSPSDLDLIRQVQRETHLVYTETRYTDDFGDREKDQELARDNYRLRVPCEVLTYEFTGIGPEDADDTKSTDPRDNLYFTLDELRRFRLSLVHQDAGLEVKEIPYHQLATGTPQKRLVEHVRTLFFQDDEPVLSNWRPLGELGRLGLPYETYKLALTKDLLDLVFVYNGVNRLDWASGQTGTARQKLDDMSHSGYLSGQTLAHRFSKADKEHFTQIDTTGQYWIPSGIAGFNADAAQHFYLPERYTDPFGNQTILNFDPYDLYIQSSTDALGNTTKVAQFDFRVLAPREMQDMNGNHTEVCFDPLGLVVASAVKGKQIDGKWQGDNLDGFTPDLANPDVGAIADFCTASTLNEAMARIWLGNAGARFVYHFGESINKKGQTVWNTRLAGACGLVREKHVGQLEAGKTSLLQVSLECSDGTGNVLMKKVQAEPDPGLDPTTAPLRWVVNGLTVLNNKGKPVKQYEPAFASNFGCQPPQDNGVTPVMYYDALGRLIRTDLPDGSYSCVGFSPWQVTTYDQNDTVIQSRWYVDRGSPKPEAAMPVEPKPRAAWLAAQHAATPALTILDSLGREVISVAHNKYRDRQDNLVDEKYLTFTRLDAEGKPLWIRDARGNLVMQYLRPLPTATPTPVSNTIEPTNYTPAYDIAGNLLFQHSMDAGDRWLLNDAAGKPMFAWEENNPTDETGVEVPENRVFFTTYDSLHRPQEHWLTINAGSPQMIEQYLYGESMVDVNEARSRNLRGQLFQHYDQSGLKTVVAFDFKGSPLEVQRQLTSSYKSPVIGWQNGSPTAGLEPETFIQITEYDALNRLSRLFNWHKGPGSRVAVYEPTYNRRGLLAKEQLIVRALKKDKNANTQGYEENAASQRTTPLETVTYNAKGQREMVKYGNGTITRYHYDPQTFLLEQLRTSRPGYDPSFPGNPAPLKDEKVLQGLYYIYDPVGNITEVRDAAYETAFFKNQPVEPRSQYAYDALYRLIAATGRENLNLGNEAPGPKEPEPFPNQFPIEAKALRNYKQSYTYDQVGNIRQMRHVANGGGWTRSDAYQPDSNRLHRTWEGDDDWNSGNAINKTTYQHDQRGNMRNLADVPRKYFMHWDYRDMIQTLNLEGGGRVYYNYDAGKQRTRKVNETQAGLKQWERLYLGGLEIYRKYQGGMLVEEIESLHLMDGDHRLLLVEDVLQTDNGRLDIGPLYRYQYSNHLGSAVLELNAQAEIISYEEYHPYGTTAYRALNKDIKAAAKRYRYTGKERDEESGLYYHGARYYAPWVGRWVSCDPIGLVDGTNLFMYCHANPVTYLDRTGKQTNYEERLAGIRRRMEAGKAKYEPLKQALTGSGYSDEARQAYHAARNANDKNFGKAVGAWAAMSTAAALGGMAGAAAAAPAAKALGFVTIAGKTLLEGAFAGFLSTAAVEGVSYGLGKEFNPEEAAMTLLQGTSFGIAFGGVLALLKTAEAPNLRVTDPDHWSKLNKASGQRIFYVPENNPGGTQVIRYDKNVVTFDSESNATGVAIALEEIQRSNPGSKIFIASGTHGDLWGLDASIDPILAKKSFYYEDIATTSPKNLPSSGSRTVLNMANPSDAEIFIGAEQTAIEAPQGSITTVRASCFSTLQR